MQANSYAAEKAGSPTTQWELRQECCAMVTRPILSARNEAGRLGPYWNAPVTLAGRLMRVVSYASKDPEAMQGKNSGTMQVQRLCGRNASERALVCNAVRIT